MATQIKATQMSNTGSQGNKIPHIIPDNTPPPPPPSYNTTPLDPLPNKTVLLPLLLRVIYQVYIDQQ